MVDRAWKLLWLRCWDIGQNEKIMLFLIHWRGHLLQGPYLRKEVEMFSEDLGWLTIKQNALLINKIGSKQIHLLIVTCPVLKIYTEKVIFRVLKKVAEDMIELNLSN